MRILFCRQKELYVHEAKVKLAGFVKRSCQELDPAHDDGRLIRWTYEADAKVNPEEDLLVLSGRTDWFCAKVSPCFRLDLFCVSVR